MDDMARRLFVGIKISTALQNELEHSAPGTKHYFEGKDFNKANFDFEVVSGRYELTNPPSR